MHVWNDIKINNHNNNSARNYKLLQFIIWLMASLCLFVKLKYLLIITLDSTTLTEIVFFRTESQVQLKKMTTIHSTMLLSRIRMRTNSETFKNKIRKAFQIWPVYSHCSCPSHYWLNIPSLWYRFNTTTASDYWFVTKPALECVQCGACSVQKNASATPTSWRSNPKRATVSRRPSESVQSKTTHEKQKIATFSIVMFARYTFERNDSVFKKNTILDIPRLRSCLSVVRGTWNRPLPHVLGCFSSFAWILHVVGEKVRALPRPEGAMDKYTCDRVNRDSNPRE